MGFSKEAMLLHARKASHDCFALPGRALHYGCVRPASLVVGGDLAGTITEPGLLHSLVKHPQEEDRLSHSP